MVVALAVASAAHAGMRLTLVMVAPENVGELQRDEKALKSLLLGNSREKFDMDKEWHGIHFLLTGDPWSTAGPYGQVIFGGREIGPDLGYGPARVLSALQVKNIAAKLQAMPPEALRARYDPRKLAKAEIYPDVWELEGAEALDWLIEGYRELVAFYGRAAAQGKAVILAIL